MIKYLGLIKYSRVGIFSYLNQSAKYSTQVEDVVNQLPNIVEKSKASKSFAQMFKESNFVALGDLENKYLIGKIVDIVGDDLYIDYGGKFNCVVKRPEKGAIYYKRNKNVKIKLVSFEMASYFLNAARHITLLESDAELVGLLRKEDESDERSLLLQKEIKELNSEPSHFN
ncbi:28S ribosomal mitochondrial [Brachionus plicatilis]|uniref:28S ribosomal mitochondrial n=1 Tax=Brachionus plicatilis TaxID=10195 RepID=A0A3M7P2U3_BRAPC|nr:28S ribosomal mitochondrial [Brachionus plicatilis]